MEPKTYKLSILTIIMAFLPILAIPLHWIFNIDIMYEVLLGSLCMVTYFVALIYTDIDKANKSCEKLNVDVMKLERCVTNNFDGLTKELSDTQERISKNIANQINSEYSLLNIVLKNTEVGKYFENLIQLHRLLNNINRAGSSPILSRSLNLMIKSTQYIEDFFKQNELGGIYKISNVVELYQSIAQLCDSLIVIEPECRPDYEDNYGASYITFIESDLVQRIKEKTFLFLDREARVCDNSTVSWLCDNQFNVRFWDKVHIRENDQRKQDYLRYSHVIFKINDHYISNSVLPTAAKKDHSSELTNFNMTEEVYLAFRVFSVDGRNENYDKLEQLIRMLIAPRANGGGRPVHIQH